MVSSGKWESDESIANWVITHLPATQTVAIRSDTSIWHISTEGVDDKLPPIREVGYGARRRSSGVGNLGGGIVGKQPIACLCVNSIKFPVPLTEEHHVTGNEHDRLRGLWHLDLPHNFTCPRVACPVQAKGLCTRNVVDKGRAQVQVSVDRLGDKTVI